MFTLDEAKPSCLNEKGSNDRPFRIDVFTIATKPLNITQQMRQILLSISPEIVPNVLTTDSFVIALLSNLCFFRLIHYLARQRPAVDRDDGLRVSGEFRRYACLPHFFAPLVGMTAAASS